MAAIENVSHFEDFRRPKFSYAHLLYSLLVCIYLNRASNLRGPLLCRVNQKCVKYWNSDLRPVRVHMCFNLDFCAEDVYYQQYDMPLFCILPGNGLREVVKQFDLFV